MEGKEQQKDTEVLLLDIMYMVISRVMHFSSTNRTNPASKDSLTCFNNSEKIRNYKNKHHHFLSTEGYNTSSNVVHYAIDLPEKAKINIFVPDT